MMNKMVDRIIFPFNIPENILVEEKGSQKTSGNIEIIWPFCN